MLRRQGAQRSRACPNIGNSLLRSRVIESAFIGEKFHCSPIRLTAKVQNSLPKLRHFVRELTRSSWRFPQPKRDRRRRAVRIFHIAPSRPHTFDAPRMSAQKKDVSRKAFHREVFIDGADVFAIRLSRYGVV